MVCEMWCDVVKMSVLSTTIEHFCCFSSAHCVDKGMAKIALPNLLYLHVSHAWYRSTGIKKEQKESVQYRADREE